MKAKRILFAILSMALVFGVILAFTSCGGTTTECTEHKDENGDGICDTEGCGKEVEKKPDASADTFNEKGELYLFKNGTPTFQFVIGNDEMLKHVDAVEDLATALNKANSLTGDGEIKIVAQSADAQAVEILIGTVTNRGDEYKINKYDYGNTGYIVKQIGTKIVVTGGSDAAITSAINYLKATVFGIKKNNDPFVDFVMAEDKTYETKQSNYSLKDITIDGTSIKNYVITYSDTTSATNATNLQTALYNKCGIRLETMTEATAKDRLKISFRVIENDGEGDGFYVTVDENKNLNIECEYDNRSVELATEYFEDNIFKKNGTYAIAANYSYSKNYRDIYYKDYARGDGQTDDFFALKQVHDLANENLLNVHADPNQTYYIGKANGNQTITIKTNTYWHGCKFIFDDEVVEYNTACRQVAIFTFASDTKPVTYWGTDSPVQSLEAGAKNIGWAPGKKVMLVLYQSDIRHYIRYGANASQSEDPSKWGQAQHELIIVDENGNVDPSTPVQWTYTKVTQLNMYSVDDREIEIRGEGENGNLTTVTTWYNNGPGAYFYYMRNLYIARSNMTISGIEHIYDKWLPYDPSVPEGNASPYSGFTQVENCNNVIIDNFIFECPETYYDIETVNRPSPQPNPTGANMGSYEMTANSANNITWQNCTQSNFFEKDGTVVFHGNMGTNFCKNLTFDNMFNCSFDAHCGVYNGTIRNSTLEHINYIGAGTITLENVTVYADGRMHSAINLRGDYGSTWNGDVNINGLTLKLQDKNVTSTNSDGGGLKIFYTTWTNHFFGYTTYLPQNISIRNLLSEVYSVEMVNSVRKEDHISYNAVAINLYTKQFMNATSDFYRDKTVGGNDNKNPMVPTKKVELFTEYTGKYAELGIGDSKVPLKLPVKEHSGGSTMFRDTEYWIDGELQ